MWLEVLGLLAGGIVGATMISLAVDYFICEDTLVDNIEEEYPDCSVEVQFGGQPVYYCIISVE